LFSPPPPSWPFFGFYKARECQEFMHRGGEGYQLGNVVHDWNGFGAFTAETISGGRRRWIVFETTLFVSLEMAIFNLLPKLLTFNKWAPVQGKFSFFFNFICGSNCNWIPEFQCNLQNNQWFSI
jgi:hypothetical protein